MTTRNRPSGCCIDPQSPRELPDQDQLVAVFKALSDPSRLAIFRLVAAQTEPICACDVVDQFDLTQPTISHHLKTLRDAGLIHVSRHGIWAYYAVDADGLRTFTRAMEALLAGIHVDSQQLTLVN